MVIKKEKNGINLKPFKDNEELSNKKSNSYYSNKYKQFNTLTINKLNKTYFEINKNKTNKKLSINNLLNNHFSFQKILHKISKKDINNTFSQKSERISEYKKSIINNMNSKYEINKKEKAILVLDLDETLIHSFLEPIEKPDFVLNIKIYDDINDKECNNIYIKKRPGLDYFINELSKFYKIYIFSSSPEDYVTNVVEKIDKKKIISGLFSNDDCLTIPGAEHFKVYIKDLKIFKKDLSRIVMIDDNSISYSLQKENGIPIKSWYGDKNDIELFKLLPILKKLSTFKDVRTEIKKIVDEKISWTKSLKWLKNENKNTINASICQNLKIKKLKTDYCNKNRIKNNSMKKTNNIKKMKLEISKYNNHHKINKSESYSSNKILSQYIGKNININPFDFNTISNFIKKRKKTIK